MLYGESVHYEEGGEWKEIDNGLSEEAGEVEEEAAEPEGTAEPEGSAEPALSTEAEGSAEPETTTEGPGEPEATAGLPVEPETSEEPEGTPALPAEGTEEPEGGEEPAPTEAEGSAEPETATEGPGEPAGQSGGISAGPEAEAGTAAAATEAVTATPGAEGSATPEAAATAAVTPESVALEAEALAAAAGNGEAELSEQERAASSRVLRNRANGRFQVKLPKLLTGRRNIEVRLDGYKLSMGLEGAQRSVGEASEERGDTTGLDGNGRRIYRGLSSGKVRYPEALAGADLEYVVEGTRLKENLVLKEEPAAGFAVTYRLRGNKLEAELQEDGSVKLVNGKTGAAVGRLGQPVLYDAAGEESREVAVELAAGKRPGEYQITYRPSEQYLGQATYPVVLDPLIEAETAGTNIRDAKVCSGEPDKELSSGGIPGRGAAQQPGCGTVLHRRTRTCRRSGRRMWW